MIVKGQKINSRYEIIKSIGEGGMANVYLANDTILDRYVAVKVLRGDLATDEKFVRRFQREALSASSLSHPNIVEIYDVGEDCGDYYIVMEYIEGKNLKQLLKKRGKLTIAEVVDIMIQITSAMSLAHDSLIIHRDLKPQNILIKDDGEIKITDFGIAMALNATQLTQTNSAMGSVHYFPPEQANGKGSSLKSDVYSLGIMMYELLTGNLPFKGDNAVEIALKHLKEPIPKVTSELPETPQSIENIIVKATAKNPKNRYNNAREMYEDLKTSLDKDRMYEAPVKFKYDEGIDEDTVVVAKNSAVDDSLVKEIKDAKKPKDKKLIIAGVLLSVLLLGLLFIFIIYPSIAKVPEIKVPDVSELSKEDATQKLKKVGLTVSPRVEEKESDKVKKGYVIETNPAKDENVKKGTEISLIVSKGVEEISIVDYTGQNYAEVKAKLELEGLIVTVSKKTSNEEDTNLVIGQSVEAGSKLKKGEEIILYVPKEIVKEYYPDMEGWSLSRAQNWADKNDIDLVTKYQATDVYDPGVVIKQSKNSSDVISKGDKLTVTISKKAQSVNNNTNANTNQNTNSNNTNGNKVNANGNTSSSANNNGTTNNTTN